MEIPLRLLVLLGAVLGLVMGFAATAHSSDLSGGSPRICPYWLSQSPDTTSGSASWREELPSLRPASADRRRPSRSLDQMVPATAPGRGAFVRARQGRP